MEIRMGFVRKVYSILAIQLLVTFAIAIPISFSDPKACGKKRMTKASFSAFYGA